MNQDPERFHAERPVKSSFRINHIILFRKQWMHVNQLFTQKLRSLPESFNSGAIGTGDDLLAVMDSVWTEWNIISGMERPIVNKSSPVSKDF